MPMRTFALVIALAASACGGAGRIDSACRSNADCKDENGQPDPTQLCATGLCEGGLGVCAARPTACPDTNRPVCGCDGRTYQNSCFAELNGIRLQVTGACVCRVDVSQEDNDSECLEGQFCALDNSCENPGGCLPIPETCDPSDTQQVCGCDGITYANECTAFQAGVRVSALGACECDTSADCPSTDFCSANTCDGLGTCEPTSSVCPPDAVPVTGCNGVVYPSACDAIEAGERVRPES